MELMNDDRHDLRLVLSTVTNNDGSVIIGAAQSVILDVFERMVGIVREQRHNNMLRLGIESQQIETYATDTNSHIKMFSDSVIGMLTKVTGGSVAAASVDILAICYIKAVEKTTAWQKFGKDYHHKWY